MSERSACQWPDFLSVVLLALLLWISLFCGWRALMFCCASVFSVALCVAGDCLDALIMSCRVPEHFARFVWPLTWLGSLSGLGLAVMATSQLKTGPEHVIWVLAGLLTFWLSFRFRARLFG